jgi:hypothetical protein
MKRLLTLLLVLFSVVLLASVVSADGGGSRNSYFIGLWEGVDTNDGSRRTVSISDNDRDGVFELIQYDTFWTLCGDDKAIASGTGTVDANGILNWSGTLTCITTGTTISFSVDYSPVRHSDILVEQPVGIPLLPGNLHRVSTSK